MDDRQLQGCSAQQRHTDVRYKNDLGPYEAYVDGEKIPRLVEASPRNSQRTIRLMMPLSLPSCSNQPILKLKWDPLRLSRSQYPSNQASHFFELFPAVAVHRGLLVRLESVKLSLRVLWCQELICRLVALAVNPPAIKYGQSNHTHLPCTFLNPPTHLLAPKSLIVNLVTFVASGNRTLARFLPVRASSLFPFILLVEQTSVHPPSVSDLISASHLSSCCVSVLSPSRLRAFRLPMLRRKTSPLTPTPSTLARSVSSDHDLGALFPVG